ncbi:MAG: hypothetical protein ACJAVY_001793, partial [Marinoscillum sp.]
ETISHNRLNQSRKGIVTFIEQLEVIGMGIQSIKVELIHWLTELQDQSVLEQMQAFKQK